MPSGQPSTRHRVRHRWRSLDPLIGNAVLLTVNTAIASAFGLSFWALATNRSSTAEVGSASAFLALFPLVATFGALGLEASVFRHYASSPNRAALVTRSRRIATLLAAVLGFAAGWLSPTGGQRVGYALAGAALGAALGSNLVTTMAITASRRAAWLLFETTTAGVTKIAVLVALPEGPDGIITGSGAGIVVSAFVSWAVVQLALRPERTSEPAFTGHARYAASNWFASSISIAPAAFLASVVLWRAGAEAAGLVAVATLFSPLLRIVPSMVQRSFFAEAAADPEQLLALLRRAAKLSYLVTVGIAGALAVLAPQMLDVFGEQYREGSVTLIRLLALTTVIAVANYFGDAVMNIRRDHTAYVATSIAGTVLISTAIVVAAPYGATGIGLAWVFGELAYGVVIWLTVYFRGLLRSPAIRP